ncbi:MAG: hypothetical protein JAY84_13790 [Candidatus Thiodiazotropha taylori]|nr:hypothetical protein [Candidatus Thiodiazotropha taylori]
MKIGKYWSTDGGISYPDAERGYGFEVIQPFESTQNSYSEMVFPGMRKFQCLEPVHRALWESWNLLQQWNLEWRLIKRVTD